LGGREQRSEQRQNAKPQRSRGIRLPYQSKGLRRVRERVAKFSRIIRQTID